MTREILLFFVWQEPKPFVPRCESVKAEIPSSLSFYPICRPGREHAPSAVGQSRAHGEEEDVRDDGRGLE